MKKPTKSDLCHELEKNLKDASWTSKGYSRTPLTPLDLTIANSAPGHYSRYWAYTPLAQLITNYYLENCDFWGNKFVNILNTKYMY
jgi:hypothetical protein